MQQDKEQIREAGNKKIAIFMGYSYIEENVVYDTGDYYTCMERVTLFSKTPILITKERELQLVPNPDYNNFDKPVFNSGFNTLHWETLNRDHFIHPEYHSSWDWLMPVVEKIEEMIIKVNITTNCIIFRVDTEGDHDVVVNYKKNKQSKIEGVYIAVLSFLDYHKSNPS